MRIRLWGVDILYLIVIPRPKITSTALWIDILLFLFLLKRNHQPFLSFAFYFIISFIYQKAKLGPQTGWTGSPVLYFWGTAQFDYCKQWSQLKWIHSFLALYSKKVGSRCQIFTLFPPCSFSPSFLPWSRTKRNLLRM